MFKRNSLSFQKYVIKKILVKQFNQLQNVLHFLKAYYIYDYIYKWLMNRKNNDLNFERFHRMTDKRTFESVGAKFFTKKFLSSNATLPIYKQCFTVYSINPYL